MFFEVISIISLMVSTILWMAVWREKRETRHIQANIDEVYKAIDEKQSEINKSILEHMDATEECIQNAAIEALKNQIELRKIISDDLERNRQQITRQTLLIDKTIKDNEQLKKKLEFFTEIGSDSKQLNLIEDVDEQETMLEEALREIKEKPIIAEIEEMVKPDKELKHQSIEIDNTLEGEKVIDIDIKDSAPEPLPTEMDDATENDDYEETSLHGSILDKDQSRAYSAMENTSNNYFITGKAGTGKSFLLRLFERGTNKKTLKVAPTGIAALNIGGVTIHSMFGYNNLELDVDDIDTLNLRLNSEKKMILRQVETIIIDEISMVRSDTFEKMDKILRVINGNNELFGGKQILAFGDLFQLPPIAHNEEEKYLKERYGGIFFFFSSSYRRGDFKFIELRINHRQKQDKMFFEILNRIREGNVTDKDIALINQRVVHDEDDLRRIVRLFPKKKDAEWVNESELEKIPACEYTYEAKIILNKRKNKINIESFPITATLKLKLGALVMMVNNDVSKRWVNGTLGIISFINHDVIKVKVNDIEYEVHKNRFESREAVYSNGRINYEVTLEIEQYPIVLAYAITIHKSQGMTYQRIACDLTECFAPGQTYVALSRCSSLGGIHLLKEITSTEIAVDSEVKDFYINTKRL